jgi:hypothetical protein
MYNIYRGAQYHLYACDHTIEVLDDSWTRVVNGRGQVTSPQTSLQGIGHFAVHLLSPSRDFAQQNV